MKTKMFSVKDLFKGVTIGEEQSSGGMSVYPLIGEDLSIEFASFDDIKFKGSPSYGKMLFDNASDKPFILPAGYTYMSPELTQDHSTATVQILSQGINHINNACCIQQHQTGHIANKGEGLDKFGFLPLELRQKLIFKEEYERTTTDCSKLWDDIIDFQKELVENSHEAHLIYFFTKYMEHLSRFNAEFEIVPKQRGVIVTFNHKIVGIDISPTHEYFNHIWKPLIRDSYGSALIKIAKQDIKQSFNDLLSLDLSSCENILEIEKAIKSNLEKRKEHLFNDIDIILGVQFEESANYKNEFGLECIVGLSEDYGIEFISNNENFVNVSLLAKP